MLTSQLVLVSLYGLRYNCDRRVSQTNSLRTDAALILHDGEVDMSAENLSSLCKAANIDVPAMWFSKFATALATADVEKMCTAFGSAPAAGGKF